MIFNSATYVLLFLPTVAILYWHLPSRARLWLLFTASLAFYGFWRLDFIPLILFSGILDYYLALWIDRTVDPGRRRRVLLISVVANLLILGVFKYLNFAVESVGSVARLVGYEPGFVELNIILPLGISFYIFQTLSYTIDVYRKEIPAERDMLKYLCFVTFFAHMVAGPILRARVLLPQFDCRPSFDRQMIIDGLMRIVAGLFLKVVLADTIAGFVDAGFAKPTKDHGFHDAWTLAFLFGFQIYFDFAGYSHIAIGSAQLLGIRLPENFAFPYMSASPREFWQRWHISLSTWIRDYLYLPLLGTFRSSRDGAWDTVTSSDDTVGFARRTSALFATWIIMGLWHGANWTFALWGLYHAVVIQVQRIATPVFAMRAGIMTSVIGFVTTLPVMMAGWVPFRCRTVNDALLMWAQMLDVRDLLRPSLGLAPNTCLLAASMLIAMVAAWMWTALIMPRLRQSPVLMGVSEAMFYAVALPLVMINLQIKEQFIYFQF